MLENRIKISSILENQLPEFIKEEYPLVYEFLNQYYLSLESQGSPLDLLQNIDQYIKVDALTNLKEFTYLNSDVSLFDSKILVDSTDGFPESYGLILIDDEIITYKSKTSTTFEDCVRGFSAIESFKNSSSTDKLVFTETEASDHQKDTTVDDLVVRTKVFNLSILFLKEFFTKVKKQILPGLENKDLYDSLDEKLFIKQSNDFYSSKGTEDSFKILFGALYGSNPKIILPRDYLIQPSDAQFRVTQDLIIESIEGNPFNLLNGTLYQDAESNGIFPEARGTIADVKRIFREGKPYYILSLDSGYDKDIDVFGSIKSNFKIHPKTLVTNDISENSTYIDVDSTIGFPDSGELVVDLDLDFDGINETSFVINYTSKSLTQFFGCSGIILPIKAGTEIKINSFAYGFNYLNEEIIKVRITGVISGMDSTIPNSYYEKGDLLNIITLGDNSKGVRENNWFFNISTNYEISNIEELQTSTNPELLGNSLKITFIDNHSFVKGDKLSLFFSSDQGYTSVVNEINNSKEIIIRTDENIPRSNLNLNSKARKNISKFNTSLESVKNSNQDVVDKYKTYSTNIQNVYIDYEKSSYVTAPSLPSYLDSEITVDDLSYVFPEETLPEDNTNLIIVNHGYYSGSAVVFRPSIDSSVRIDNIGLTTSVCYTKVIDDNTIKLSRSKENIFTEKFVTISGQLKNCRLEIFDFNNISFDSLRLEPQNLIKKLSAPKLVDSKIETDPGSIGIFVNGIELLNYKSLDKVFYGPIEKISVTSSGDNYDVINPPDLEITDKIGKDCKAYCSVIGELKRFDIIDPGFDYIEEPSISITGGNGSGAKVRSRMITFTHAPEFNSEQIDLVNNIIEFSDPHKLKDSEKVIYDTNGQKSILGLVNNSEYYVSIASSTKVKLHNNLSDSISKTNPITFNESGLGFHRLKCLSQKKKISSIEVLSAGSNYQNKKTKVSKIDTASDELIIVDHGYLSGEVITYYPQTVPIVGLTSSKSYYVTKIDDNKIKLSEIGPDSDPKSFYNNKKYINLTSESSSNHYFNYEPITVSVSGKVGIATTSSQDYNAKIVPIFRGRIQSVFVENGGVGYGSSEIINFDRQPNFNLSKPTSDAQLTPIITNGSIERVIVQLPGINYKSVPNLIVKGKGSGAILAPVIINGSISEVKVVYGGFGYEQESTFISIETPGQGATFKSIIKSWRINLVEKYISNGKIYPDDGFISNGLKDLQYFHLYPSRLLRSSVYSKNLENNDQNYTVDLQLNGANREINSSKHSPIIGWAYDGNPIYGPYGYSTNNSGPVKLLRSGYSFKYNIQEGRVNGPDISLYPLGTFIEDYEFKGIGDLDEYNGRYCSTPEFPNGVYAYFSTFSESSQNLGPFLNYKAPVFPYVIGNYYKSTPIEFNFNQSEVIDDNYFIEKKLLRNTTPYNLTKNNSGYEFIVEPNKQKLQEVKVEFTSSGKIDSIEILNSGSNYKVNDSIILDDGSIVGKVTKVGGKNISSITSNTISVDNIEFYPYGNYGEFVGISTLPHNFYNNSLVTLTSKYEYRKTNTIKVLENSLNLIENIGDLQSTGLVTYFKVYGNLDFPVKENDFYQIDNEIIKILNIDRQNSRIRILRGANSTVGFITSHNAGSELKSLSRKVIFNTGITSSFYNYKLNDEYYFNPETSVAIGLTEGVGITSTLFLSVNTLNTPVIIEKGLETTLYFVNQSDINYYSFGGYVDITNSSFVEYNSTKKRIVSIGNTFIKIDFNTSSFPGSSVDANLNKWDILNIPTKTIYLPNHKIETNDLLIYNSNGGTSISISTDAINSVQLQNNSLLYAVKINNDLVGISTEPVSINSNGEISGIGTNNNTLYFSGIGTSNYHSFKTNYPNILKGTLSKNISTVSTSSTHGLQLEDFVDISVESGISTTIKIIYNDTNKRFVINPKTIENINTIDKTLRIQNHGFVNGEKVIYNSDNLIGGLENNKIYYIIVIDSNNVSLTNNLFETSNESPNIIQFTSDGSGTLSSINPNIKITKYQDIVFDVSDSSLSHTFGQTIKSSFDLKLFYDNNFNNEFGTFDIIKSGTIGIGTNSTITLKTKDFPNTLYYTLIPIDLDNIPISKKEIYIDLEQINHSKISLNESEISGKKKIINLTSNTFTFDTFNPVESKLYNSSNSILKYETDSKNVVGDIKKVNLKNVDRIYNNLPQIKSINSNSGSDAILQILTNTIGNVSSNNIIIEDIGFNYSVDNTVRPKCKFPTIIKVSSLSVFDRVDVLYKGLNYISSPDLIVLDGLSNQEVNDIVLDYNFNRRKVTILQNTKGINKIEPVIIPINNDNGFLIKDIFYDSITNDVTVVLEGEFSDALSFPFALGDEILIENVNVFESTEDGIVSKGYNSENYNYKFFKIKTLIPNIGGSGANFSYNLGDTLESGETPGIYDIRFNKGTVIPKKYLPRFSTKLKNVDFVLNEIVTSSNNSGIIKNWDSENNYLKVLTEDDFINGDTLIGQTSNIKGIIEDTISFETYFDIDSNKTVKSGWKVNTGFLNDNYQRIYDSDYYQYFSYSIESEIEIKKWEDVVGNLNHTSGFKKFGDMLVQGFTDSSRVSESQDLGNFYSESIISDFIDLNCVYDFDLVTENSFLTNNKLKSNEIYFDSRIIQDYIESVGNRVLIIDDISDKFTIKEPKLFEVLDEFEIENIRYKKYFIHIYDILDPTRNESLFVSLLHDNSNGFLNQYAVASSEDFLGNFDFQIQNNSLGQLVFYPSIPERKIYKFGTFSTGIGDSLVGVATTSISIGGISKIEYVNTYIPKNESTPISLPGISTSQRACKVLVSISNKENSYYQFDEISILHDDSNVLINNYGSLNNLNVVPSSLPGIVTFSSSIESGNLSIKLHPNVGIGTSLFVNATITSIDSDAINESSLTILENILVTNFISTTMTGSTPETKLIFTHSNRYNTTYSNILIKDKTNNTFEYIEMNTLLNNSIQRSYVVEYGVLNFNQTIGNFTSEINGVNGSFELYFTPYEDIDYEIKILTTILNNTSQEGVVVL